VGAAKPQLPHMQTLAVIIRLQNAFDWLVKPQDWVNNDPGSGVLG
jgi:hypothetical protein